MSSTTCTNACNITGIDTGMSISMGISTGINSCAGTGANTPAAVRALPAITVGVPSPVIRTYTPLWARLFQALVVRWQQARQAELQRQQLRSLSGLSDDTLRDIGMARAAPLRDRAHTLFDYERSRW